MSCHGFNKSDLMPTYFLHVRHSDRLNVDSTGMVLPNIGAAKVEALKIIEDLLEHWPTGWPQADHTLAIEVADSVGQIILKVPVPDDRRLKGDQAA